jgi:hypothetical protein
MLSKCANPHCSNTFRYLYEGSLYLIESSPAKAKRNDSTTYASESRRIECAWLCSSCCRHMSIRFDQELGAVVVGESEQIQDKKLGCPSWEQ